jgi:hypothetical protein
MSAADTARRLRLPCPVCDQRGQLTAYCYGTRVAVSCTGCGHAWTEPASLHALLRRATLSLAGRAGTAERQRRAHGSS